MAQIEPVVFPFAGTATTLDVKILPFNTSDSTCGTYYQLLTDTGVQCIQGNYYLTDEQFQNWGQDNSYIDELVAASIPVTLIPPPPTGSQEPTGSEEPIV